jgi:hypothetical protein
VKEGLSKIESVLMKTERPAQTAVTPAPAADLQLAAVR